jgi:hypothetical protein
MSVAHTVLISRGCFLGNVRAMMSTVYAEHGRTACQRNGQARRLQDGLVIARQRSGQGTFNAEAAHRLPVE